MNALFLPARFRHKTVPEVLPNGPVLFQVDQNTDLAAVLISDKPDSGHGSIILWGGYTSRKHSVMRLTLILAASVVALVCPGFAQTVTWSEHISPIVYN